MINKIRSIKATVYGLLTGSPETQDNDRLLMLKVWAIQNPQLRWSAYSFLDFAGEFIKGTYADPESIRRARQLLQEQHPALRGASYRERHNRATVVKAEIKHEHYPEPIMKLDRRPPAERKDLGLFD